MHELGRNLGMLNEAEIRASCAIRYAYVVDLLSVMHMHVRRPCQGTVSATITNAFPLLR